MQQYARAWWRPYGRSLKMRVWDGLLIVVIFVLLLFMFLYSRPVGAQEHPPQDMALHDKFYSGWLVPNAGAARVSSCCNKMDCAPADTKFEGGHWYGRRRIDPQWILIPDQLIESNQGDPRESPDGQSHLCVHPGGHILCAVLGGGI